MTAEHCNCWQNGNPCCWCADDSDGETDVCPTPDATDCARKLTPEDVVGTRQIAILQSRGFKVIEAEEFHRLRRSAGELHAARRSRKYARRALSKAKKAIEHQGGVIRSRNAEIERLRADLNHARHVLDQV